MIGAIIRFMEQKPLRYDFAILAIIVSILGFMGGLPFYHPDFLIPRSLTIIPNNGHPPLFNYPGLLMYLNVAIYGLIYLAMNAAGTVTDWTAFQQLQKMGAFTLGTVKINSLIPGQLITVFLSVVGVICVFLLVYRMTSNKGFSYVAAIVLASSPLWVQQSHFLTVDLPMASFVILTILLTLTFTQPAKPLSFSQLILLGIFTGISASAKYNGGLVIVSILSATFVCYKDHKRWFVDFVFILAVSAFIFLITNPFILLDFTQFKTDFEFELHHTATGHFGYTTDNAWLYFIQPVFVYAFSVLTLVVAVIGFVWSIATRQIAQTSKLVIITFPVAYYLLIGSQKLSFHRYGLPIAPFIAINSAMGLYFLYHILRQSNFLKKTRKVSLLHLQGSFIIGAFLLIILPNASTSIRELVLLSKQDTRVDLENIINLVNLDQPNTAIRAGTYIRGLFSKSRSIGNPQEPDLALIRTYIFDSFSDDRSIYEGDRSGVLLKDTLENMDVIQISPFTIDKPQVPFSPESVYSPYLPDIDFRYKPGPFIEIYISPEAAQTIFKACQENGIACSVRSANEGYYYQNQLS